MKVGDIVYFKSQHTALYGKQGGSYEYHFKPGDRCRIDNIFGYSRTSNITNLEDGTSHFMTSIFWDKVVTVDEWRELQLEKLNV
jgi:hypothetical protein